MGTKFGEKRGFYKSTASIRKNGKTKCRSCGKWKPDTKFSKSNKRRGNRLTTCIQCINFRKYGINYSVFEKMKKFQNNRCAICNKKETEKSRFENNKVRELSVDHNHKTGEVRGLLCRKCNTVLGLFFDDTSLFQKAVSYLRKEW